MSAPKSVITYFCSCDQKPRNRRQFVDHMRLKHKFRLSQFLKEKRKCPMSYTVEQR